MKIKNKDTTAVANDTTSGEKTNMVLREFGERNAELKDKLDLYGTSISVKLSSWYIQPCFPEEKKNI